MSFSTEFDASELEAALLFLNSDLPLHIVDEEDDLYPLLKRRCEPDDQIEDVLGRLSDEHASDGRDAIAIVEILTRALDDCNGLASYAESKITIPVFCAGQKRNIAIKNAVILPIARLRLSDEDLKELGRKLATRRELADPFGTIS